MVETEMSSFTKTETGGDAVLGMQTLKRLARPEDISGGPVAFLASDATRSIIGDTLRVDGGSKL